MFSIIQSLLIDDFIINMINVLILLTRLLLFIEFSMSWTKYMQELYFMPFLSLLFRLLYGGMMTLNVALFPELVPSFEVGAADTIASFK